MQSKYLAAALLGALLASPAHALTLDDITLPDRIRLQPDGPELVLNGAGIRQTFMIIDTYTGGLYLEKPSHDGAAILQEDRQRRMLFHVLLKRVTASKVARALKDALVVNISRAEQADLEPAINQFLAMFDGILEKGDEVTIDYLPGQGTHVIVDGKDKGIIPGKGFADALLSVWVGKEPVSEHLKAEILGLTQIDRH